MLRLYFTYVTQKMKIQSLYNAMHIKKAERKDFPRFSHIGVATHGRCLLYQTVQVQAVFINSAK